MLPYRINDFDFDCVTDELHVTKVAVSVAVLRQFQDYVKPEEAQARHTVSTATSADSDGAVAAAPSLGDSTLTVNIGIPIVVVLTKVCNVNLTLQGPNFPNILQ